MIGFVRKIGKTAIKMVVGPLVSQGRGAMAGGKVTWALHALLVLGVAAGLWWLNGWLGLEKTVHAPSRLLREMWLPLLFLLGYSLLWVGFWIWRVLNEPDAVSPFPDLDRAWRHAAFGMRDRGIDLASRRLVLVLGRPREQEAELIGALELTPEFGPSPTEPTAPLRVLADEQSIYLICPTASAASACSEKLAQERVAQRGAARQRDAMEVEQRLPAPLRATSAGPPSDEKTEAATATAVATVNVAPTSFGDEWDADGPEWSEGPVGALVTKDESERMTARLEHLVGVLAREREPVAPIDGVVITTPAEAVASSRAATAFAASVARDLDAVERGAGAKCPVTSLVTELQHTPGAGRLLHALPVDRKRRRFGADLPASEMTSEQALHDAVEWTTQTVASGLVNRLLQATPGSPDDELTENADLFEFQRQWSIRGDRLANVLTRGLAGSASGPWPLAGCYLVATGDPVGGGQAFGGGALRSLLERTPSSEWTDSALRRDARQNRTVAAGWASLSAAGVVVACLLLL